METVITCIGAMAIVLIILIMVGVCIAINTMNKYQKEIEQWKYMRNDN